VLVQCSSIAKRKLKFNPVTSPEAHIHTHNIKMSFLLGLKFSIAIFSLNTKVNFNEKKLQAQEENSERVMFL